MPEVDALQLPAVSARLMRELDDIVINRFTLTLEQMMENAGRSLAEVVINEYHPDSALILAGPGHNGGGGLVCARHLHNRGVRVTVVMARPDRLSPATEHQLGVLREMGVSITDTPLAASVVIDALVGYALDGEPRGRISTLIDWAREQRGVVVALDVPSGLDATTGRVSTHCIHADVTVTLALPKTGIAISPHVVGRLYLADISIPRAAYAFVGLNVPVVFADASVVRISAIIDEIRFEEDGQTGP